MNNSEKLVLALAIFLFLAAVFVGISQYVNTIDVSTVPQYLQKVLEGLQAFFAFGAVMMGVAYFRNITGYGRNWFQQHADQTVQFEFNRFADTFIYYGGVINGILASITPFIPVQFQHLFQGVVVIAGFVVDLGTAELKKILPSPTSTPTPTPAPAASDVTYSTWIQISADTWQRYVYTPGQATTIEIVHTDPNPPTPVVTYSVWSQGQFSQGPVWLRNVLHNGIFFAQEYSSTDPAVKVTPIAAPTS